MATTLLRFLPALVVGVLLVLVGLAWWESSRYSDRYRVHLLGRTVETFSANSALRISFVDGIVPNQGGRRHFRQRNAGGRLAAAPLVPSFRAQAAIFEVTLGYWHLFAAAFVALGLALLREGGGGPAEGT
jgi:hypothetical protein